MPRTPLAWANLTHDRVRFALFVLGVVFAVVLMFIQVGFRGALLDSNTLIHENLNADLVLISPNRQALAMREPFNRRRLVQAAGVPGVRQVHPLYIDNGLGMVLNTNPDPEQRTPSRSIRVIGVDPDAFLLDLPELDPHDQRSLIHRLKTPGAALYDRKTRTEWNERTGRTESVFGPLAEGTETELAGRSITLVGSFSLGPDFTTDGALIVSDDTFAEILRRPYTFGPPLADVDLGLIRLEPGADRRQVQAALRAVLAHGEQEPDVDVLTPDELIDREHAFWLNNTPIGFAFMLGMFMGFAVGMVICYQILSGDITDHMPEYATLKAVGYSNRYLAWVVVQEALILAVAGFAVGFLLSWAAYWGMTESTGMPLRMTLPKAVGVFAFTVGMCVLSGMIALVKLLKADPADVF